MSRASAIVSLSCGVVLIAVVGAGHLRLYADTAPRPKAASSSVVRSQAPSPTAVAVGPSSRRGLLDKYCIGCHNAQTRAGSLVLTKDRIDVEHVGQAAEVWEKVVRKVRSGAMPPVGRPRPDEATYSGFVGALETALDRAAVASPNPGRAVVHRLNRVEYTNAIRDLLALEIDGRSLLPADDSGYGFDNIGDVLSVSPGLLERYLVTARKVSRLAVGDPTQRPVAQTYEIPRSTRQNDRMSEDLPFRSRGGMAIRHYFALDGEYFVRIGLQNLVVGNTPIRGIGQEEQIEVRLDGERIKVFTIGGRSPQAGRGGRGGRGGQGEQGGPAGQGGRGRGGDLYGGVDDELAGYQVGADRELVVQFPVKAGPHLVGVSFVRRSMAEPEMPRPALMPVGSIADNSDPTGEMQVDTIQIGPSQVGGSGDTPSRRQIFVCQPGSAGDEAACATKIVRHLVRRAYRRPVTDEDVESIATFYRERRKRGNFEAGIEAAITRLLVAPEFLFRVERDPERASAAYRISDVELASRLSFFLWSSIPDEELLRLAERRKLREPKMLEQQVRRMLADPRATTLVTNFGAQWLRLRNIQVAAPDRNLFPEFDDNLRTAMQQETELFLESQIRDDRPLAELLSANYTFLNERLARHYKIPRVYGDHFRRVTLSPDSPRAGLLGQGSLLTASSYSTRTSPVLRGKLVLELLGAPPPAPPADVPPFPESGDMTKLSVRARMEEHRKNPVCASCHAPMDPLGFALETFDAVGKWRTTDGNNRVDASSVLPDGTKVDGAIALRELLVRRRDEFTRASVEKLLTYALGRGVEYYDMPAVRKIVADAGPTDHRWSSVILGIVKSLPFQQRSGVQAATN